MTELQTDELSYLFFYSTYESKGGFKSEDRGRFLLLQKNIPNLYHERKI